MLIVMEQGYARRPGEPAAPSGPPRPGGPGQKPTAPRLQPEFSAFEEVMVKDLIPMIDATYRTIPDRDNRAMAGLSMGGMQTLQITLKHLDLFSYIGGFSGGGGFGGLLPVPGVGRPIHADPAPRLRVRRLVLALRRRGMAVPVRLYLCVGRRRART